MTNESFLPTTGGPTSFTLNKTAGTSATLHRSFDISTQPSAAFTLTSGILATGANQLRLSQAQSSAAYLGRGVGTYVSGTLEVVADGTTDILRFPLGVGSTKLAALELNLNAAPVANTVVSLSAGVGAQSGLTNTPSGGPDGIPDPVYSAQILDIGWTFNSPTPGSLAFESMLFDVQSPADLSDQVNAVRRSLRDAADDWERFTGAGAEADYVAGDNPNSAGADDKTLLFTPTTTDVLLGGDATQHYTLYSYSGAALPVELVAFAARRTVGDAVQLTWTTATETNNDFYEVQRQVGTSGTWEVVGTVAGAGNSLTTRSYSYNDPATGLASSRLFYRLRQVDLDGTFSYSNVVEVNGTQFWSLRPNPVTPDFTIVTAAEYDPNERITARLTNTSGQVLISTSGNLIAVTNALRNVVNTQPSGVYVLNLQSATNSSVLRLVKP